MSRIGKNPVIVPNGVTVTIADNVVTVAGPKGTLSHTVAAPITVAKNDDGSIAVNRPNDERIAKSLHGVTRPLIANMVIGVTDGYSKTMEISGTGYRVAAKGKDLEFSLGYSHPVPVVAPDGIAFAVESPTLLHVSGIDKQLVGETAAKLRKLRKTDPYKAKGVKYKGEVIRRKAGKAGKKA
ncbi:MAG: 50S ribosomal protein L6 [Candidatus Nanopelagicales bacterium]